MASLGMSALIAPFSFSPGMEGERASSGHLIAIRVQLN
jgi:hypothetical protein